MDPHQPSARPHTLARIGAVACVAVVAVYVGTVVVCLALGALS